MKIKKQTITIISQSQVQLMIDAEIRKSETRFTKIIDRMRKRILELELNKNKNQNI